jgi:hypothetical protein
MSSSLIDAVIQGVILEERTVQRIGTYRVTEYVGVSHGARNQPNGYWEHVYERGGFECHNSFYGDCGEPFKTPEEAAIAIIKRRGIVAVDAKNHVVRRK